VSVFQSTLPQQLATLHHTQEQAAALPLEVWAMDESRFGLQTVRRRRLTLRGVKPVGRYQHAYENFYLYGAVAPRTGAGFFEARLKLDSDQFQAFLDALSTTYPDTFNVLILDNARAHRATTLQLPANVALLFQPPYAPELNPCERVWLALKDDLAWRCFADVSALQDALALTLAALTPDALQSLTAYPYLTLALYAQLL